MKKILIGTHNNGKFKEISHLISKKILKISPSKLKIISPKETGKTFFSNARLKANFFQNLLIILLYRMTLVYALKASITNQAFIQPDLQKNMEVFLKQ